MRKTKSSKSNAILIELLIIASLFTIAIWQSWKVGFICSKGDEIVYWERARFFLGQSGATHYDGKSLVSLGYSIVLMPICAIIKNPLYAYKAAVFLNGCFLCAGYIVSVKTARRLFPEEHAGFLALLCALAAVCPVFAVSRFYTGPDMILLFLLWVILFCLAKLQQEYRKNVTILLTVCMVLVPFFDVAYIGISAAALVALWILVRQKKLGETTFLTIALAFLIGLAAGNIAERFVLAAFCKGKDIVYSSSLEVFLDGISDGWKKAYLFGLIRAAAAKLYAVLLGSFLLVCPVIWDFARKAVKRRKNGISGEMSAGKVAIGIMFALQLLLIALYDASRSVQDGLTSVDRISLVLLPIIVMGIVQLKNRVDWAADVAGYLLLFCVCTFMTANQYNESGVTSFSRYNNGILMLFQNDTEAVASVYMASCVTILIAIAVIACLKERTKRPKADRVLRAGGSLALACVFLGTSFLVFRDTVSADKKNDTVNAFAAAFMLSDIPENGEIYYLAGASGDSKLPKVQALVPGQEIELVKVSEKDEFLLSQKWNHENSILITGSDEETVASLEKRVSDFRILYMTKNYAIWGYKDGAVSDAVEQTVLDRLETVSTQDVKVSERGNKTEEDALEAESESETGDETETELTSEKETELSSELQSETEEQSEAQSEAQTETEAETPAETGRKHTYGKGIILAPGTYHLEVHMQLKEDVGSELCQLSVKDSDGTITDKFFNNEIFDENGQGAVGIEFTSADVMRSVRVILEGDLLEKVSVEAIYYRKTDSAYTVGLNEQNLSGICEFIDELDRNAGVKGSISFVDDAAAEASDVSLAAFELLLPEYELSAVSREALDALSSDYLIGETAAHAYFGAMQNYSILLRGKTYTVLVRNDSQQARAYLAEGNTFLSNGTRLELDSKTGDEEMPTVSLERGTYKYCVKLHCQTELLAGDENASAGTLLLYDGETLLASVGLTNKDLMSETAEVGIPFSVRVKVSDLHCEIEMESAAAVSIEPVAIELVSEKYQYGSDERKLQSFFDLVNAMGTDVELYVTQSESYIADGQYAFDYLQENMPEAQIQALSPREAIELNADALLLVRSTFDGFTDLLGQYSIIGHAGVYTLWARNDGNLLQRAVSAGAQVYNSGKKLSPESIAAIWGYDLADGLTLEKGRYAVTIELQADRMDYDDTVEVSLLCDKTEKQMQKEIEELLDGGKTLRQAQKEVDPQKECGSASAAASDFDGRDTVIIKVSTDESMKLTNLVCEAFSWYGADVEGRIVWIEKL